MSYALINYSCFDASLARSPGNDCNPGNILPSSIIPYQLNSASKCANYKHSTVSSSQCFTHVDWYCVILVIDGSEIPNFSNEWGGRPRLFRPEFPTLIVPPWHTSVDIWMYSFFCDHDYVTITRRRLLSSLVTYQKHQLWDQIQLFVITVAFWDLLRSKKERDIQFSP